MVSELVSGKPLTVAESPRQLLDVAVQIADGLAAAHHVGIIHRDLKPQNILITREGRIKILDFGLAKAVASESDETVTSPGTIMGTVAYMSPEQARGANLDVRSDQFSFGLVLYEMATSKKAFQGGSTVETLAAIIKEEAEPIARLNPKVPPPVRWIIERCMAKNPAERYASTSDLFQELRNIREKLSEVLTPGVIAGDSSVRTPRSKRSWWPVALLMGLFIGCVATLWWSGREPAIVSSPRYTAIATEPEPESQPAWSPDGETLAYVRAVAGVRQIFIRSLRTPSPAQITTEDAHCAVPQFSPDGGRIYYLSKRVLWSVGAAGGEPQAILRNVRSFAVAPDGKTLAFYRGRQEDPSHVDLFFSSSMGDKSELYRQRPFPNDLRSPMNDSLQFSPDGTELLVRARTRPPEDGELWRIPMKAGTPRRVGSMTVHTFSWVPHARQIVFASMGEDGTGPHLMKTDVDGKRITPVTGGVGSEEGPAVSPDGKRLAFTSIQSSSDLFEIRVDGSAPRGLLTTSLEKGNAAWAPSGTQFAYSDAGGKEILLRSTSEGWSRPLLRAGMEGVPEASRFWECSFSADGQRITFVMGVDLHQVGVSNLARARPVLIDPENRDQHAPSWSPDGNWIAYARLSGKTWEVVIAPSGGGGKPKIIAPGIPSAGPPSLVAWSPSGAWIAYAGVGGTHLVTPEGKDDRLLTKVTSRVAGFSKDGSLLYFLKLSPDRRWRLLTVDVHTGKDRLIGYMDFPPDATVSGFSMHPDGTRFATTVAKANTDIWMIENFARP